MFEKNIVLTFEMKEWSCVDNAHLCGCPANWSQPFVPFVIDEFCCCCSNTGVAGALNSNAFWNLEENILDFFEILSFLIIQCEIALFFFLCQFVGCDAKFNQTQATNKFWIFQTNFRSRNSFSSSFFYFFFPLIFVCVSFDRVNTKKLLCFKRFNERFLLNQRATDVNRNRFI